MSGVLACGVAQGALAATPPVSRIGDRLVTAPLPGTPTFVLKVRYMNANFWPGATQVAGDVQALASPEPAEVMAVQDRVMMLDVRSTWQGFHNLQAAKLSVIELPPEMPRTDCTGVFLTFKLADTSLPPLEAPGLRVHAPCPDASVLDPERQLVVEGLDDAGTALFAVVADDPRWHIHEGADAQGNLKLLKRGRDDAVETYVSFDAPVDDRLTQVRIWQVEPDGNGQVIATIAWPPSSTR